MKAPTKAPVTATRQTQDDVWAEHPEGPDTVQPRVVPWPVDVADAVDWFEQNLNRLPSSPFVLGPGIRVVDSKRFITALEVDIAAGPSSARARSGGLLADLQNLQATIPR
jgi:hypothetical protein